MRGLRGILFACVGVTVICFGVACKREAPDTRAADEQAIWAATREWSNAYGAKDLEKIMSFYAEDASVLPPNAPIATGKEVIHKALSELMAMPGFALRFAPTKVEVARAGDLAYEVGTYQLTMNDAEGKPVTTPGKYVVVWKKQADGTWKGSADSFNADQ